MRPYQSDVPEPPPAVANPQALLAAGDFRLLGICSTKRLCKHSGYFGSKSDLTPRINIIDAEVRCTIEHPALGPCIDTTSLD